jgi:hypothetical protein
MAKLASALFVSSVIASLVACSAPAEDGSTSALAVEASEPRCQLRQGDFDRALFADLAKTLDPSMSHAGTVNVPGALTATADAGGYTKLVTVLAASVELDDDPPPTPSGLDIMGEYPDAHHADRTAHRLYDAMTRGTEDNLGNRTSKDGRFECDIVGWKGGTLYHCMLRGLIDTDVVTLPSSICRP